jgi:RNA polymerase nonessential primary-like sigma factor
LGVPHTPTSTDPVRLYLQDIGRVDLLTQEQELTLARLVQRREQLLREGNPDKDEPGKGELGKDEQADKERRLTLHRGKRAKERMIQANLRLVVSVAKKYQRRGMDLLDLVQEGTLGLERAVERFDPTRGFRFSTYAYWWIRQGITRALASQSRTIRLPVHITEKLNRIKRAQRELSARLGRLPCVAEIAQELNLSEALIRETLLQLPKPVSLEARVGKEHDMQLGDLLEDGHGTPEQELTREQLHNDLEALLEDLSSREAEVIRQRFGLVDDTPRSLTEIGTAMQLSRERVRQIESRALLKLRQPQNRCRVKDYLGSLD